MNVDDIGTELRSLESRLTCPGLMPPYGGMSSSPEFASERLKVHFATRLSGANHVEALDDAKVYWTDVHSRCDDEEVVPLLRAPISRFRESHESATGINK